MTSRPPSLWVATRDYREARSAAFVIAFAAVLAVVPGLVVPMLVRAFLNRVLVSGNVLWEIPILIGLVACGVVTTVLVAIQWHTATLVATRLSASTSAALVWHVLRLPTSVIERFGIGGLTARVSMLQVRAFQAGVLVPLAFVNLFVIVVYAVVIVILDPVMGAAAIVVVLVSIIVSGVLLLRRRELQDASSAATVSLSEQTTRVVTDMETIKASAAEQWVFDRWSQERSGSAEATSALEVDGQRLGLVSPFTQAAGLGIMLALGSLLVFRGSLDLGSFVAIQALLTSMLIPAGQIVWLGVLAEGVASPQRLADEVRDLPVDVEVSARGDVDIPGSGPVALSVRDLRFGYDDPDPDRSGQADPLGDPPLFDGLSLEIPAGAWLAVVGGSGSGKSTLARLCVGELQPWSGEILLDGVPRLATRRAARCAAVGYVPQYPQLTPGTVLDNVRMFDPNIPEAAVVEALSTACVLDAIDRRPGGLQEMVLATGHGFSGGELQRLAIARALVRGPRLLVLDEATSALDPIVEAQLEERLRKLSVTCLVIAHRLSTVRDADEIVVLERGAVVQRGSFDELRLQGRFKELVHG